MNDQPNSTMMDAAATLQKTLEDEFGTQTVNAMIGAVSRAGVSQDMLARIVTGPNAAADFTQLGQNALLAQMQAAPSLQDSDFRAAEAAYDSIRTNQREQHRASRGRSR
jgi:hypothetical protein